MAKITPKVEVGHPEGYIRTLMRWRENGDIWGSAPPATASMVKEGAAFLLKIQANKVGVPLAVWNTHWKYMRDTYDHKYLKQFHLDYLSNAEWEVA